MKVSIKENGKITHRYDLDKMGKRDLLFGRQSTNDIKFVEQTSSWVSRQHGHIYRENGKWVIEDTNSRYGIYYGGQKITKRTIKDGTVISMMDDKGNVCAEMVFEEKQGEHTHAHESIVKSNVQSVSIEKAGYVDEEARYSCSISKFALIPRGAVALIFWIWTIVECTKAKNDIDDADVLGLFSDFSDALGYVVLIAFGIAIVLMVPSLIFVFTTKLDVTNKRIKAKRSIFPWVAVCIFPVFLMGSLNIPLDRVDNVTYMKGLMGRIFNYGSVYVYTGNRWYRIPFVSEGEIFVEQVMAETDIYKRELISK